MSTPNYNLEYQVIGQQPQVYTTNINNNWDIIDTNLALTLTDVQLSTLQSGDVLIYDKSGGVPNKWSNYDFTTADIATVTALNAHINDLANPHVVTPAQVGNSTAQWNANQILGVTVDDTAKADTYTLQFDNTSGNIIYGLANADRIKGITVDDSGIADGRVLLYDAGSGSAIWGEVSLSATVIDGGDANG